MSVTERELPFERLDCIDFQESVTVVQATSSDMSRAAGE